MMSISDFCVVEVGTHPAPFYVDKNNPSLKVCSRHKAQYEERKEEFGPFDWELQKGVGI